MSKPRWRGSPKERDDFFEWVRKEFLTGPEGFVHEDLDSIIRIYKSDNFPGNFPKEDDIGRFMIIERKHISVEHLKPAQVNTFGLIDALLRLGDPDRKRYLGFYILKMDDRDPYKATKFEVNGRTLSPEEVRKWLMFELDVYPYKFRLTFHAKSILKSS